MKEFSVVEVSIEDENGNVKSYDAEIESIKVGSDSYGDARVPPREKVDFSITLEKPFNFLDFIRGDSDE